MAAPALSCRVGCERELDRSCAGGYASDRVGGCTAQEISDLTRVSQRLPLLADLYSQRRIASNILNAYLGPKTEPKVLAGQNPAGHGYPACVRSQISGWRDRALYPLARVAAEESKP